MNKTSTKPLIFYFLFLVGFSLLLVECDRFFPSGKSVPAQFQPGAEGIKNIILQVPLKPVSHATEVIYAHAIKGKGSVPHVKGSFVASQSLSAYNFNLFNNYAHRFSYYMLSPNN